MAESAENVVRSAAKVFAVPRAFGAEHPEPTTARASTEAARLAMGAA